MMILMILIVIMTIIFLGYAIGEKIKQNLYIEKQRNAYWKFISAKNYLYVQPVAKMTADEYMACNKALSILLDKASEIDLELLKLGH